MEIHDQLVFIDVKMMRAVLSDKGCPESKPEALQKALFYTVVGCDIQFSLVVRGVNARIRRFQLVENALPLPVKSFSPANPTLESGTSRFTMTLRDLPVNFQRLSCFASNEHGPLPVKNLGEGSFEILLFRPFSPGRGRINCTVPAPDGRWHWFGMQYYVPQK